ncbi:protein lyl-1 isoform X2 [Antechinus flavipes]|uniref:protein lyl-1 isoform X2 n=1 Tax=Antechinus flavipes TaxID=38775 RepID=UPI0022354925|nr:protein lyl-1 isoform X2 [Antechinus flavipes]
MGRVLATWYLKIPPHFLQGRHQPRILISPGQAVPRPYLPLQSILRLRGGNPPEEGVVKRAGWEDWGRGPREAAFPLSCTLSQGGGSLAGPSGWRGQPWRILEAVGLEGINLGPEYIVGRAWEAVKMEVMSRPSLLQVSTSPIEKPSSSGSMCPPGDSVKLGHTMMEKLEAAPTLSCSAPSPTPSSSSPLSEPEPSSPQDGDNGHPVSSPSPPKLPPHVPVISLGHSKPPAMATTELATPSPLPSLVPISALTAGPPPLALGGLLPTHYHPHPFLSSVYIGTAGSFSIFPSSRLKRRPSHCEPDLNEALPPTPRTDGDAGQAPVQPRPRRQTASRKKKRNNRKRTNERKKKKKTTKKKKKQTNGKPTWASVPAHGGRPVSLVSPEPRGHCNKNRLFSSS